MNAGGYLDGDWCGLFCCISAQETACCHWCLWRSYQITNTSKYTFGVAPKKSTFFNINWKLCSSRGGTFPSQPENLCYDPESTYRFHPSCSCLLCVWRRICIHIMWTIYVLIVASWLLLTYFQTYYVHILRHQKCGDFGSPCNQFDPFLRVFYYVKVPPVIIWMTPSPLMMT